MTCVGVAGGAHQNTSVTTTQRIALAAGYTFGCYQSQVCDGQTAMTWTSMAVLPAEPYGKELLAQSEVGYLDGNTSGDDLVGLWHLNSDSSEEETAIGSGQTVSDSSQQDNHGTTSNSDNTGMSYIAGKFRQAIQLDGTDDYVEVPGDASLQGFSSLTVQVWSSASYSGDADGYKRMVAFWPTADDFGKTFQLSHFATGNLGFMVGQGSQEYAIFTPWGQTAGDWHHLVALYDGVELRIFVDGQERDQDRFVSGPLDNRAGPLWFGQGGSSSPAPVYGYDGVLDEIAIWKRGLSPDEIRALYRRGVLRITFQVRSCSLPDCQDGVFVGPSGSPVRFYTEADNSGVGPPVFDISHLAAHPYLQWRACFATDDPSLSPELADVSVLGQPQGIP